jgi:uncharacterized membrane protein
MWMALNLSIAVVCVAVALWLRPWRMLRGPLLSPALAALALLPWLLLVLMLGWPLAVLVLGGIALVVWVVGQSSPEAALLQWVWVGLVPATMALGIGALLRRWLPPNPFVYTLGRAFLGTAAAVFLSGLLFEGLQWLADQPGRELSLVARWLMAWGDAFLTGMFGAIFVAFVPQWLATWSDARYLKPPQP